MAVAKVTSKWSSGNLVFKEKTAGNGAAVHFGEDASGLDVKCFGSTTGKYFLWDESADKCIVVGTSDMGSSLEADAYTVGGTSGASFSSGSVTTLHVINGLVVYAS